MKRQPEFRNLLDLTAHFPTEESCHQYLAKLRWGKKPVCPHCGCFRKIYILKGGRLMKCADCRKPFTVRIGTIFEDSALPLQKWFFAFYLVTAHKKGISSMQLSRDIGVTQKTAWFMLHRIRHILADSNHKPLDGIVEVDETFIGGKDRNKHLSKRQHLGTGGIGKAAVLGMLDRDDKVVVTAPVDRVNARTLQGMMKSHIHVDSTVMTDEWVGYNGSGEYFKKHERINHHDGKYADGEIHTNTIEGFWSLLKRGIIGIYHQVSVDHLHRYCDEFSYRYNTRKVKDAQRFARALGHVDGRLTYKKLTAN